MNKQEQPLFTLAQTALIAVLLMIPFLLRLASNDLEPYPAALLPSGAGVLKITNNTTMISTRTFLARSNEGKWTEVKRDMLIEPIPPQYLSYIVQNDFGVTDRGTPRMLTFRRLGPTNYDLSYAHDEAARQQAAVWLRNQLSDLGLVDSGLLVRTTRLTIDHRQRILEREITDERTIELRP